MKNTLTIVLIFSVNIIVAQTSKIKLITPGEHLGYFLESFSNNHADSTDIEQGETWTAVYLEGDKFKTRKETLRWDTLENFTIHSKSQIQPIFYIQGLDTINKEGDCTVFKRIAIDSVQFPLWKSNNFYYFLGYTDNI